MGPYGFYDLLQRNAEIRRDRVAVTFQERDASYGEFLRGVDRLAAGLARAGLGRGDRLAVLARNSDRYLYLFGAAAKIGALVVPINWRLRPGEVEEVLSDAAPELLVADPEFTGLLPEVATAGRLSGRCYLAGGEAEGWSAFESMMQDSDPSTSSNGASPGGEGGTLEDGLVVIYTAATDGRARGAVLTHGNVLFSCLQYETLLGLDEDAVHAAMLPFCHIAGLGLAFAVMHSGGRNIVFDRVEFETIAAAVEERAVTVFASFPPILKRLTEKAREGGCSLRSVRSVVGLEVEETARDFEEASGGTFWACYGQTETTGAVALAPFFARSGSAGLPSSLSRIRIAGEDGNFLACGGVGEILVRSPLVFRGYLNRGARSVGGDGPEGWHRTGDLGSLDSKGYLWYHGRKPEKELIKPGGENVYPAEVESALREHPDVVAAAVIGVPDDHWGEAVKAICVLASGSTVTQEELAEFVGGKLASYKKPKHVVFAPELPLAEDGTPDREGIKRLYG